MIVLPEDRASLAEASVFREESELLFSYNPRPRIFDWLYPLFGHPDRWMDASVTVWK